MKRISIETLGCKLNQFESDSLATTFVKHGYQIATRSDSADAHIINTCTVTGKADRKSRNLMYQAQRRSSEYERKYGKGALVVVTGCYAEHHKDEIAAYANTYVVGNERKSQIFEIVDAHLNNEILDGVERADYFDYATPQPLTHTRGMLKIQDGCDNYCTFCIIPFVRGRARSRPAADIVASMKESIAMGYKEVVITGVNISRYRHDEVGFSELLEQIVGCDGDYRVRLSSLEPDSLDDRFFELLHHPKMAPHLHLCVQSGSERILLNMRRQYSAQSYRHMVERIRTRNARFNITTDIIVGFPGETEQDFADSCDMVRDCNMGHVHIFPYAVRNGTRAQRMDDKIPIEVIKQRCKRLQLLSDDTKKNYRQSLVGEPLAVLIEKTDRDGRRVNSDNRGSSSIGDDSCSNDGFSVSGSRIGDSGGNSDGVSGNDDDIGSSSAGGTSGYGGNGESGMVRAHGLCEFHVPVSIVYHQLLTAPQQLHNHLQTVRPTYLDTTVEPTLMAHG